MRLVLCFVCPIWPIIDISWTALRALTRFVLIQYQLDPWLGGEPMIFSPHGGVLSASTYWISAMCGAHSKPLPDSDGYTCCPLSVSLIVDRSGQLTTDRREESWKAYLEKLAALALAITQCVGTVYSFDARWQAFGSAGMSYSDVRVYWTAISGCVIIIPSWLLMFTGVRFREARQPLVFTGFRFRDAHTNRDSNTKGFSQQGLDFFLRFIVTLIVSFYGLLMHMFRNMATHNMGFFHN